MRIKWFSGIRVVGLVMVLLYHFYITQFSGGFVGVDVFFTFSGFLITALFIDELQKKGTIDLLGFYRRRLVRIFPPLLLAVLVSMVFTLLVGKDFVADIGKQIAAALGFTTNYFEIANGGSYENNFFPHLFVHTWSLAVEVHFYLIWGLLVSLLGRSISRSEMNQRLKLSRFRAMLSLLSLFFLLITFLAMFLRAFGLTEYSPIYFSSVSHSFPFFIGAFLATLTGVNNVPKKFMVRVEQWQLKQTLLVFFSGLAVLVVLGLVLNFNQRVTYLFGFLLASGATALMIYGARILHEKTPNIKEPKVLTFFADISYGMYLFHWPLFTIFSNRISNHHLAVLLTVGLSILFAAFSYYILEPLAVGKTPQFFDWELRWNWRYIGIPMAVVGMLLLGTTVTVAAGAPQMTSLEQQLWTSHLQQDEDALRDMRDLVDQKKATEYQMTKGVSVIGDSVTLGVRQAILDQITDSRVDAAGGRRLEQANAVMAKQQKKKLLREYVIISCGTNTFADYEQRIKELINDLEPGHKLIFVTPFDGRADETWDSQKLANFERTLPDKYDFITIADWNKIAAEHMEIFVGSDTTHFAGNPEGEKLYLEMLQKAIAEAKAKPVKSNQD